MLKNLLSYTLSPSLPLQLGTDCFQKSALQIILKWKKLVEKKNVQKTDDFYLLRSEGYTEAENVSVFTLLFIVRWSILMSYY